MSWSASASELEYKWSELEYKWSELEYKWE